MPVKYNENAQTIYSAGWMNAISPSKLDSEFEAGEFDTQYDNILKDIDKGPEGKTETGEGLNWLAVSGYRTDETGEDAKRLVEGFEFQNHDPEAATEFATPLSKSQYENTSNDLYLEFKLGADGKYNTLRSMLVATSET